MYQYVTARGVRCYMLYVGSLAQYEMASTAIIIQEPHKHARMIFTYDIHSNTVHYGYTNVIYLPFSVFTWDLPSGNLEDKCLNVISQPPPHVQEMVTIFLLRNLWPFWPTCLWGGGLLAVVSLCGGLTLTEYSSSVLESE